MAKGDLLIHNGNYHEFNKKPLIGDGGVRVGAIHGSPTFDITFNHVDIGGTLATGGDEPPTVTIMGKTSAREIFNVSGLYCEGSAQASKLYSSGILET